MAKPHSKIALISTSLFAITFVFVFFVINPQIQKTSSLSSTLPVQTHAQEPKISEITSPDGKLVANLIQEDTDNGSEYTFSVKNLVDNTQKNLFRLNSPVGVTLTIPQNTFSPTNTYAFLKQNTAGENKYLVLKVDGEDMTKDTQTLEVSSLFYAKFDQYKITDVTGWGGYDLLIVNVDNQDGSEGPSFWFDLTTHSFIRLSNRFN